MTSHLELYLNGDLDDDRPLPELVIEHLGGEMAYVDLEDGTRLYRVVDWVYEIKGSKSNQRHTPWADLKRTIERLGDFEVVEILHTLEIETAGGKQLTDFTDEEGLYALTQRMSDRSPTVRQVKDYLARAGVFVDELRTNKNNEQDDLLLRLIAENPDRAVAALVKNWREQVKTDRWIERRIISLQNQ